MNDRFGEQLGGFGNDGITCMNGKLPGYITDSGEAICIGQFALWMRRLDVMRLGDNLSRSPTVLLTFPAQNQEQGA